MATTTDKLNAAVQHHQAGRLPEAERLYREILGIESRHVDALLLLGMALRAQGRVEEAVASYEQALQVRPDFFEAHNNLGNALRDLGKLDEAFASYGRAVELKPDYAEAHNNLGVAFRDRGRWEAAAASYRRALQINPNYPDAHYNLGRVLSEQGQHDEAVSSFQRALQLKPDYPQAHNKLGTALAAKSRFGEAEECFGRALQIKPDDVEAHNNLANVLSEQGKFAEAEGHYRHALQIDPLCAETHNNLGNALAGKGRPDDAVASYQRALEINPDYGEAQVNLGKALRDQGKLDAAMACYQRALKIKPESAQAHFNQSVVLLLRGDFEQGWTEYEWRWQALKLPPPESRYSQPLWDGSTLDGKTIFLYPEQGFGDTIQFVRFAQLLKTADNHVALQAPSELFRLFSRTPGIDNLVRDGSKAPAFDVHAPLMSLPRILGTTLETIPRESGYVRAEPALIEKWKEKFTNGQGLKTGLVWQGNTKYKTDRNRSIKLQDLSSLLDVPGIRFIGLQMGAGEEQIGEYGLEDRITHFMDEVEDFADTAAIIENLDLVITVDTSVAHLAGAMGKATWVLLPFVPDWRWMLDREDSPWYPTMRLFRQQKRGKWDEVIDRVASVLRALVRTQQT